MKGIYGRAVARKPTSVTLTRRDSWVDEWGNTHWGAPYDLDPQRARIEYLKPDFENIAETGGLAVQAFARIIGTKSLDIKKEDQFTFNDVLYVVKSAAQDSEGVVALASGAVE